MSTRALLVLALLLDVVSKVSAWQLLPTGRRFAFTTTVGPIGFVPSMNDALAFSLPVPNAWIWPVGWIVVFFLLRAALRSARTAQRDTMLGTAMFAIILGAVSNLFDRTLLGGVIDYFSVTNFFPAFNVADLLILLGITGWIVGERRRTSASH